MNPFKFLWKHINTRVWLLVTAITLVVVFTATMIATQVTFLRSTLNILWGGDRAIISSSNEMYENDYEDKASTLAAANKLNIDIAKEGFTLLKNDNNTLPLAKNSKVSVFGKNSVNLVYGGSGSGGGNSSEAKKTIYDSLSEANFTVNTTLKNFYENNSASGSGRPRNPAIGDIIAGFSTGETPIASYTDTVKGSYSDSDAALVVLSRIGGEGFDLPRTMAESYTSTGTSGTVSGARSSSQHYLQLDQNERDLLVYVCANFSKVVVIINSNHTLELGFLNTPSYWTDVLGVSDQSAKIGAALWIGSPGGTGIMALGPILNGDVNPSGRTVDTYAKDFTLDPTYKNFGNQGKDRGNAYLTDGSLPSLANTYFYIDYEEGIYVGYRYYETRGATDGESWYNDNVIYPLGYGLSYSDFEWTVGDYKLIETKSDGSEVITELPATLTDADKDKSISVDVTVKNKATSLKAGKDIVQLYVQLPYTANGIEKSHVVMTDFAKTEMLAPGETSQPLTLKFNLYDIASYDYNDANGNGFKGYELEGGSYKIHVSKNAHSWKDANADLTKVFTVGSTGYKYQKDQITDYTVENRFDDAGAKITKYLSRANWISTFPTAPIDADRTVTQSWVDKLKYKKDDAGKPWQTNDMPTQSNKVLDSNEVTVKLGELVGKDFDDPLWATLLDQLTIGQMADLIGKGAYGTTQIENIDKPLTREPDGPSGFTNFMGDPSVHDTCFYVSECVIGATYSKKLAFEMGKMIGNEGLMGYTNGDGLPYSGWYAPGVNIHRSQFSGRNWEYYSEDATLSGKLAAQVILGAADKGVYAFVKHFALNDLETSRDLNGILVWANEQSMREIYLKPFETSVKEGKTIAVMSSFNRIGKEWAGGSYNLLTEVLRNEWGFRGMVVTDYALSSYMNIEQMIRAGGDLCLTQGDKFPSTANPDATQVTVIRKAAKNILYTIANSNAMNAIIDGYKPPVWVVMLIWVNIGLLIGFAVWGFFAIRSALKKSKAQ